MAEKEYPPIELKTPYWKERAKDLFLEDYEDSKRFYAKYSEATDFYYELSKLIASSKYPDTDLDTGSIAYKTMYDAFAVDASNNNHEELDKLIINYTGTK